MARRSEVREIGQFRYRITQMKARQQYQVLERLANRFGDPVKELIAGLGTNPKKALIGDLSSRQTGEALGALLKSLEGNDLTWLVDQIRPTVEYQTPELAESKPDIFARLEDWDDHFADSILDGFKVLLFALELNYSSFFVGLGGLKEAAHKLVTPTKSV